MPEGSRLVVVADPIDAEALSRLGPAGCEVVDASGDVGLLDTSLPRAWALIVRSRTKVTAELLSRAPHLELVARAGVGLDNVDLDAAIRRHVRVVNAPTAATTSVAELTLAFLLMLSRELFPQIEATKDGAWKRGQNRSELSGKTVGFIGYGRIARKVAALLAPLEVSTLGFDPFVTRSPDRTELVPLAKLLERSDFVSLHAAATEENRHLLDRARFAQMKPGAFVINVARGSLIDEAALVEALDSGRLGGAALDVFESEPPTNARLLSHPKVIATPHLGASTREGQRRAGQQVVDEVLRAAAGEPLHGEVRPGGAP